MNLLSGKELRIGAVGSTEINEPQPLPSVSSQPDSAWSIAVLWGEECSGQREKENKCGWVIRWDPGDYQIHVCLLERTASSFKVLVGLSGGSIIMPPGGENGLGYGRGWQWAGQCPAQSTVDL